VLFRDLNDSAELAARLDPEDFRAIITASAAVAPSAVAGSTRSEEVFGAEHKAPAGEIGVAENARGGARGGDGPHRSA
jgi:hypothetical protein